MKPFSPRAYQSQAIARALAQPAFGLFADPGLGKTAATLATVSAMLEREPFLRVLIVAPLRVIYSTWPAECKEWQDFAHLETEILHGPKKETRLQKSSAPIFLINPEGLPWLFGRLDVPRFDVLVIDESSKFKSPSSQRFKLLKKHLDDFDKRIILTGTPAPNGLGDVWSQIYLLDKGAALGKNITTFRREFCQSVGRPEWRQYEVTPRGAERIYKRIAPLVLRLSAADYLDLPDLLYNDVKVELPPKARKQYDQLESELFAELDGAELLANTAGHNYLLCRQFAGGAVYGEDGEPLDVHSAKVDAVRDLVDELQGKPVLIAYNFRHELARLREVFKGAPYLGAGVSAEKSDRIIADWNASKIPVLLGQPKSMGHGLNLQKGAGRDVVWFSLTDSLEDYEQFNRRIYRQGVTGHVRVHRIVAEGTIDRALIGLLNKKHKVQHALFEALSNYRKGKGTT